MFGEQLPFSAWPRKWKLSGSQQAKLRIRPRGAWEGTCEQSAMAGRQLARISMVEMQSYYLYSKWCSWLHAVAKGESGA